MCTSLILFLAMLFSISLSAIGLEFSNDKEQKSTFDFYFDLAHFRYSDSLTYLEFSVNVPLLRRI